MKRYNLVLVIFATCINLSFGQKFTSDSGDRDLLFDSIDIQILTRANAVLVNESYWSKADDRKCQDDIDANKYSLFCALYKASLDIMGEYNHRRPGLQQIRWIIGDKYSDRLDNHRLMNFNNHPDTTFNEIKRLLAESLQIIEQKIAAG